MKRLALALCLSLALVGCGQQEDPAAAPKAASVAPAPSGPVEQVEAQLAALRNNDLAGLMKAMVPQAQFAEMRADYEQTRAEAITEEDRKQFDESIGKLIAEGGVDRMMAELEPKLVEMKPQLPMVIGMGMMMAQQSLQESTELSEAQKAQMSQMMTGLQTWAMQTDFADPARLRRALEALKAGIEQSGVQRIEDLNALSFEQMLSQFGPVLGGVKGALSAYDLDVNAMLASVKPSLITMEGDVARLKIDYTMFGTPLSLETELTRKDGHWYSKEALAKLERDSAGDPAEEGEQEAASASE